MCEQHLPGKAIDSPWVSQQEEFSGLELIPSSDQGTLHFCSSAVQFLPPHSVFPLTALWLPRGLKPLWWWGIQRFLFVCLFVALKKKIPWGPCSPCSFGNGGRPPRLSHSEGIVTKGMRLSDWVHQGQSVLHFTCKLPAFCHSVGSFSSTCYSEPGSFLLCIPKCS